MAEVPTVPGGSGMPKQEFVMSETPIQKTTQEVESVVNEVAPIAEALVPGGTIVGEALASAETVANAVETNAPHATAVSDIGSGVAALATTPIVQENPQAAALSSVASSFFSWLHSEFSKL